MEKLELKHLAGYLPYELTFLNIYSKLKLTMNGLTEDEVYNNSHGYMDFQHIKPILRTLSDINKKCDDFGFVPKDIFNWNDGNNDDYECILEWISILDYNKLLEWHFDVHGLIEKGLAIDINTLKL